MKTPIVNKSSRLALVFAFAFALEAQSINAWYGKEQSSPTKPTRLHKIVSDRGNVELVLVPAGWFWMGDDDFQANKRHRVYLAPMRSIRLLCRPLL